MIPELKPVFIEKILLVDTIVIFVSGFTISNE